MKSLLVALFLLGACALAQAYPDGYPDESDHEEYYPPSQYGGPPSYRDKPSYYDYPAAYGPPPYYESRYPRYVPKHAYGDDDYYVWIPHLPAYGYPKPYGPPEPPQCNTTEVIKVCLNVPAGNGWQDGSLFAASPIFDGRYRLDPSNWEMAIAPGGVVPPPKTLEISNNLAELSGQSFVFKASYVPGSGYTWTLSGQGANRGPYPLTWTTADGTINNKSPTQAFNAIQLRISATGDAGRILVAGLSMTIKSAAAAICGSLANMEAQFITKAEVMQMNNRAAQWLIADTDLSQVAWELTGTVTGFKASNGNQESVKLDVTTVNLDLSGTSVDPCNGNTCPAGAA